MTREMMNGEARDKELTRLLKGIGDDQLDMPSFTRQPKAASVGVVTGKKA
jgi:hypothetical protein